MIPDYIREQVLNAKPPDGCCVPGGSVPAVAEGHFTFARAATVGVNPHGSWNRKDYLPKECLTLDRDDLSDIPHIRLRVSKEPAILHDGDGSGIRERRQLSHRAHKTISRCRELASARQRRRLSARLHTLQLIQVHSSPLATPVTSDDPKDTRYPGVGWSPPIRSSTCRNTSRGTAPSAS